MNPKPNSVAAEQSQSEAGSNAVQISAPSPWKTYAGIWRENPDFDALVEEIKDLRREIDQADTEPS